MDLTLESDKPLIDFMFAFRSKPKRVGTSIKVRSKYFTKILNTDNNSRLRTIEIYVKMTKTCHNRERKREREREREREKVREGLSIKKYLGSSKLNI